MPRACSFVSSKNKQIQIKKLTAPNIFETKSNNVVAQNSSGDHIIIIHGDMLINEHGWNERLLKPLFKFKDVFAVSARCSHNRKLHPLLGDLISTAAF